MALSKESAAPPYLERDALYIRLLSTNIEGTYIWALVFVDASGFTQRYEWAMPPPPPNSKRRPRSADQYSAPETFICGPLAPAAPTGTLGFFKLSSYVGGLHHDVLREDVGPAVFRRNATRVGGGLPPGTASGAWAIGALAALRERGYLHRDSPSPEGLLERQAIQNSRARNMTMITTPHTRSCPRPIRYLTTLIFHLAFLQYPAYPYAMLHVAITQTHPPHSA
ncbi:unnamed protein product [Peniophora sp. CBMAI 1063]|nr:unnamed protein product [Peniophora sp. CBMAI 1063]